MLGKTVNVLPSLARDCQAKLGKTVIVLPSILARLGKTVIVLPSILARLGKTIIVLTSIARDCQKVPASERESVLTRQKQHLPCFASSFRQKMVTLSRLRFDES
jgi:hypothetical protein